MPDLGHDPHDLLRPVAVHGVAHHGTEDVGQVNLKKTLLKNDVEWLLSLVPIVDKT
jgi:hypothetical protein